MSVRRALRKTRCRIETYGWRQGRMGNEKQGYCLVGAVNASTHLRPLLRLRVTRELRRRIFDDAARRTLSEAIDAGFCYGDGRLINWNDLNATFDDVMAALDDEVPA